MEKKMYFEIPTQVLFEDVDYGIEGETYWLGGIVYRDEIICGCCGGVQEIAEIYEFAHEENPIREFEWNVDISDIFKGEYCYD